LLAVGEPSSVPNNCLLLLKNAR